MRLSKVAALALIVGAAGSMSASPALAASDCPKLVELADWGQNSTGDISVAAGAKLPVSDHDAGHGDQLGDFSKAGARQVEEAQRNDLRIQGEGQIQGKRYLCHQSNGSGADGFRHVGHYRARDNQIALLASIAWRPRVAVRQVILWQRSSRPLIPVFGVDLVAVLRSGGRANLTVFGRSDDSKDDRAEQKQHEHNQPDPGRS